MTCVPFHLPAYRVDDHRDGVAHTAVTLVSVQQDVTVKVHTVHTYHLLTQSVRD